MYTKTTMMVLCLLVLSSAAIPLFAADAADTTGQSTRGIATVPLSPELAMMSDEILKMVNEGRRPNKDEVAAIGTLLLQNRMNFQKYDEPGKTKYSMLSAWNNYFAGDKDAAAQAIQAGLRSGPEDPDMRATYAAIAMATEKYLLVGRLAPQRRTAARRRGAEDEPEIQVSNASGVLNFDFQAFKAQAVSRKLPVMEARFDCLGGAMLDASKIDILCMLVYKTTAAPQASRTSQSSGEEDMTGSSRSSEGDTSSAFGELMVDYADSGKIGFIGVSLDDAAATYNAMREVSERRWFWPQVMAQKEANKSLAELAKLQIDSPVMAIVAKDGTIVYMGSPAGFLPRLLLAEATDNYKPRLFVPISQNDPNARRARMAPDPNTARRRSSDPNAVQGGPGEEDGFGVAGNVQAQKLYEHAKSFLKGTRTTSLMAGPGVQACRQILDRYSNTEYAPKARELLRDLPDEIKQRYNITPAEMGI